MLPARLGAGTVTDDTHLTVALARALLDAGGELDRDCVARRFAEIYDPARGYGGNARKILRDIRSGVSWRAAVDRHRLPGGSWANGAAMRVAPVALASPERPGRVRRAAAAQAEVTGHTHPIGRGAAELQALAVREALVTDRERDDALAPGPFVAAIRGRGDGRWPEELEEALDWIGEHPDVDEDRAARELGSGGRASQSVPAALWAFLSVGGAAETTVVRAVSLGGDTDTVGAMSGALAGAWSGDDAFPDRWRDALEDGPAGRAGLLELADELHDLATRGDA